MDPATGSFMSYSQPSNESLQPDLFDGMNDFVNTSEENAIHPALLADSSEGLAFGQQSSNQQSQPSQSAYNPYQRQTQSQSPALPQFRPTPNGYAPQQYQQNGFNAQHPHGFEQQFNPRPTPSPTSFDQINYPGRNLTYTRPQHNYFANGFEHSRQPTASQLHRSHIPQQMPGYMDMMQPQGQVPQQGTGQIQGHQMHGQTMNGMLQYPYGQRYQMPQQQTINPSDLGMNAGQQQGKPQASPTMQSNIPPHFSRPGMQPIDPKNMTMQQYHYHLQQANAAAALQRQGYQSPQVGQQIHQQPLLPMPQEGQVPPNQMPSSAAVSVLPKKLGKTSATADSDSDLEITEEVEPEARPACISISKPEEPRAAFRWDLVDAVWSDRKHAAKPEKIRSAVKFVGERIRGLRDTWKEANDQLKKAENSKQQTDGLKQQVSNYREWMEWGISQVLLWGHPSILKRLGENSFLLTALYSFLLDRVNADDYESSLVVQILKLGIRFNNVDEDQLEKVKWTKILTRFTKKCTNESKTHAQQILQNAKDATTRKKAKADGQGPASPGGSVTGLKRGREGSDSSQPAKRPVKQASKPLSVLMAEKKKLADKAAAAQTATKSEKSGAAQSVPATTLGVRPKTVAAVPQKANQFAGLLSAKKKPGTTNAERAAKEKVDPQPSAPTLNKDSIMKSENPLPIPRPVVVPAATSSFLGFLETMDKPKESLKHRLDEEPNETPEIKAKRLRKEARRKLRVSWKPESELVETRIFEHDPDEDTGHEDSQTRDVGDTGKEGEMLKKGMQAEDEDEDDSSEDEAEAMEYYVPSEVDFSTMKQKPEDDFDTVNFIKTGGIQKPESPASKTQEEMEYGKEMTIYRPGEQPTTPKEPPDVEDEDFNPVVDFGQPNEGFVREREERYIKRMQASQLPPTQTNGFNLAAAMSNLQNKPQQPDFLASLGLSSQPQQTQAPPQIDLAALFAAAQQVQSQNTYQQPLAQSLAPNVAALLGQLNIPPPPLPPQPTQQSYGAPLPVGSGSNPNPFPGATESRRSRKKRQAANK